MIGWSNGGKIEASGFDTATTHGALVVAPATPNTKGAWAQIIAATTSSYAGIVVHLVTNPTHVLLDIAVGAGGAEQIIVSNIVANRDGGQGRSMYLPLFVPAGARVAARIQSPTADAIAFLDIKGLMGGGFTRNPIYQRAECIGADTGTSLGVQIDAGATANTKGAYTQIIASLTNAAKAVMPLIGYANTLPNGTLGDSLKFSVDFATGAGGSEVILIADACSMGGEYVGITSLPGMLLPVPIANATRIAARAACANNDATWRVCNVALLTFS